MRGEKEKKQCIAADKIRTEEEDSSRRNERREREKRPGQRVTQPRVRERTASATISCFLIYFLMVMNGAVSSCYPAIFSFGTSLSDTGNAIRVNPLFFTSTQLPYGETYFRHPATRFSDGRIIIDFLAQSLGLPFLTPYLKYNEPGTVFSQGVNYAVAGATVEGAGYLLLQGDISFLTVDSLDVQINWHLKLKSFANDPLSCPWPGVKLPSPSSFSQSLYFFEFGGNDYGTDFLSRHLLPPGNKVPITSSEVLGKVVPIVIRKLVSAVETLYENEARNFFILNLAPEGCSPLFLKLLNGTKDANGCLEAFNEVNQAHNQQLYIALQALQNKYRDISIVYADFYGAYEKLLRSSSSYGFAEPINACCGAGPGVPYQFALRHICSRSSYVCPNPSSYIIWDGIHNTDRFNGAIVNEFISGQFLSPSNGLACATKPL